MEKSTEDRDESEPQTEEADTRYRSVYVRFMRAPDQYASMSLTYMVVFRMRRRCGVIPRA